MLGLTERDFDAYHPDRASSNAYSRPRLEFKQRALSWARSVCTRLQDLEMPVDVHASDEHPSVWNGHRVECQWVFFWREAMTRSDLDALLDQRTSIARTLSDPTPYYRHAFFALRLDVEKIQVCVQLHPEAWVDFETLTARLSDPSRGATITDAIRDLPEEFSFGLVSGDRQSCTTVTGEHLTELMAQAKSENTALWIGWSVTRDVAVEHAEILDEQLEDALVALAPVYKHVAWWPEDDPAGMVAKLEAIREEQTRTLAERQAEQERQKAELERQRREANERSRERTRERIDYSANRPRPGLGSLFKSDSSSSTSPKSTHRHSPLPAKDSSRQLSPSHPRPAQPAEQQQQQRRRRPAREAVEGAASEHDEHAPKKPASGDSSPDALEKGAKVMVLAGPFSGKVGVISELDGRGGARVLLGLLSTRVTLGELEAIVEAKDRPSFQSSHRRPVPIGRSTK